MQPSGTTIFRLFPTIAIVGANVDRRRSFFQVYLAVYAGLQCPFSSFLFVDPSKTIQAKQSADLVQGSKPVQCTPIMPPYFAGYNNQTIIMFPPYSCNTAFIYYK